LDLSYFLKDSWKPHFIFSSLLNTP